MSRHPYQRQHDALPAVLLLLVILAASACGKEHTSYDPLGSTRWWVYAINETILDDEKQSRYVTANVGTTTLDDERVYIRSAQIGTREYLRNAGGAVERVALRRPGDMLARDEPARTVLPARLESGQRWPVASTLGLVESRTFAPADRIISRRYPVVLEKTVVEDDVTLWVAAGRFDNCLRIDGHGETSVPTDRGNASAVVEVRTREWFARGVGLIKLERSETSASNFLKPGQQRWELLDFGD